MSLIEYKKSLVVKRDHLDFNRHVNNLVYMQWALDISREHWLSEVSEEIEERYFWVVRKHYASYRKQAFLGDKILVQTYVKDMRGPFSDRIVEIICRGDLLVEVNTQWCFMDRKTQKPTRVLEEVRALF